jgi:mannose-1-phosphate guanylyltransferase/mannose-1-phosphate guanylyltransferase/mannose-6-phosphate isomerase
LPLVREETLFEETLLRCGDAAHFSAPIVVAGSRHVEHVEAQLAVAPGAEVIVEPVGKNTAAAIALAALRLPEDSVMLVCPSDHHIGDWGAFINAARAAAELANAGWLVSFGIQARSPDTGFGYLRRGESIGPRGYKVAQFVEKPDLARAQAYLASGEYSWNGGIFAFRVATFLSELKQFRPGMLEAVAEAVENGRTDGRRFLPEAEAFSRIEGESVDYALMENTTKAAMVPADMSWSDIGNWQALHGARDRDAMGNAVRGPAEIIDSRNVLVDSDGPRVSVIGVEDIIVVVDGGEVMITSADNAHKVGSLSGAINQ